MNTKIELDKILPDSEELLKAFINDGKETSVVVQRGLKELLELPVVEGYIKNDKRYAFDASYAEVLVKDAEVEVKKAEVEVEKGIKEVLQIEAIVQPYVTPKNIATVLADVGDVVKVVAPLL